MNLATATTAELMKARAEIQAELDRRYNQQRREADDARRRAAIRAGKGDPGPGRHRP